MNESSDATFVVGPRGGIEDIDAGACRLLGYTRRELLGLHGSDLILSEERPKVAVSLDQMRRGVVERRRGRLIRKNKSVVEVEVSARRLGAGRLALMVRALADELR